MTDVVVTVPLSFGLERWIAEGDPAGEPWTGQEWHFYLGGPVPAIQPGERVYVVCQERLRGYAPLVRIDRDGRRFALVRHGGAVAVTIEDKIRGFRGCRYRWWHRSDEVPFPDWKQAPVPDRIPALLRNRPPKHGGNIPTGTLGSLFGPLRGRGLSS